MRLPFTKAVGTLFFVAVSALTTHASLIYLYDFPGNPGSGLASDQTNGQPAGATFSDFTRTNVGAAPTGSGQFASNNWNLGATMDPTQYEGFSITANAGLHLNLSSFTFDARNSATGPANMEVGLFINGSSTAYATYDFAPTGTLTSYTFNLTPLGDSDNVTTATINFFGWNATSGIGGQVYLDNVGSYGAVSSAPEPATLIPIAIVAFLAIAARKLGLQNNGSRRSALASRAAQIFVISLALSSAASSTARASVIYTYDFPGSPGSGLASDQTDGQPTGATFSDFTRNGGLTGTGAQGVFGSKNWSQGSTLDPTVFTAFTITANPLYQLNLSQLTFDSLKNGAGMIQAEVALFVNGSATAYATFAWTPVNAPMTSYTFNFTALTNSDNVTSATFEFFGWNANDATNEIQFANVATFGSIVPESDGLWPVVFLVICVLIVNVSQKARRPGI